MSVQTASVMGKDVSVTHQCLALANEHLETFSEKSGLAPESRAVPTKYKNRKRANLDFIFDSYMMLRIVLIK
jgi:hypothetical protein